MELRQKDVQIVLYQHFLTCGCELRITTSNKEQLSTGQGEGERERERERERGREGDGFHLVL